MVVKFSGWIGWWLSRRRQWGKMNQKCIRTFEDLEKKSKKIEKLCKEGQKHTRNSTITGYMNTVT